MKHAYFLYIILIILASGTQAVGQKIVEGYVFDAETNKPLNGVLIYAKNTVKTVLSDPLGNYRLIIPEKADILVFSYSGYARKEVNITGNSRVEVGMRSFGSTGTESIVTIGSRDQSQTKGESYVAVDVIPIKDVINEAGYLELPQILHYFAPSFNANKQSGSYLSDHVEPVSLRGLGTDQVLYLINGKPYINSPIINTSGTRGRGNVSTDLNAIPANAIERIEVLRDGAAAQYGSDAIAGVVNIVLKKDKDGGTNGSVTVGSNFTGLGGSLKYKDKGTVIAPKTDGSTISAGLTHSFNIYKGHMSVSANYFYKDYTNRVTQDNIFPLKYRNFFGDANHVSGSVYFNGEYPIKKGIVYVFGGYHDRNTKSYNWTISTEDSTRNVYEIYPKGYTPRLITNIANIIVTSGYKTNIKGWNSDISYSHGHNNMIIRSSNTLNASLLQQSPTSFYNGRYNYSLQTLNIDINKKYRYVLEGFNLALGMELKKSKYAIIAGEEASWRNYMPIPLILTLPNGMKDTIIKNGTTQGFPGISTSDALSVGRLNGGIYGDFEVKLTKQLGITAALRYEHYSDFGGTFGGKLAARYKINPRLFVRGSVQTGFRAPSLAQFYFRSTANDVDDTGSNYEKIIVNNNSEVARKLGIPQLTPETSLNAGIGVQYNLNEQLLFSIDAYSIDVNNRIILSSPIYQDNKAIGSYLRTNKLRSVQFFINALNTHTTGIDISSTYRVNIGNNKIKMALVANFNQMTIPSLSLSKKIYDKISEIINNREQQLIMASAPPLKAHYNLNVQNNAHTFNMNLTYFSKVEIAPEDVKVIGNLIFKPRVITDFNYIYKFNKNYSLCLGANNLFDVYPSIQNPIYTETGGAWESVQQGFSGAFFFSKFLFQF